MVEVVAGVVNVVDSIVDVTPLEIGSLVDVDSTDEVTTSVVVVEVGSSVVEVVAGVVDVEAVIMGIMLADVEEVVVLVVVDVVDDFTLVVLFAGHGSQDAFHASDGLLRYTLNVFEQT